VNLDDWLAAPAVRTHHRRKCSADVAELWNAAASVRLRDCRLLGRLVRARIPGLQADDTFHDVFYREPFNLLEEGPTYALSGLCGKIWTLRREYAQLSEPNEFRSWDAPGTVRVLFANWAEPAGKGAALVSEVRISAVDRGAALRLRAMEPFIAGFQGLIGVEALGAAVRQAAS
jgi:hypothetical protein